MKIIQNQVAEIEPSKQHACSFMISKTHCLLALLGVACLPFAASSAVVMSAGTVQPTADGADQFNFGVDATIPGGTFNQQAFSDNAGPPGQTFTTPAGSFYTLNSFSYKGAENTAGNFGGNVFTAGTTFGVRVSAVSGTSLSPLLTVTGIPTTVGAAGDNWFTWTFSGLDTLTLAPSTTYAFETFSSAGWLGFDAALAPTSYADGVAFNSTGLARQFSSNILQDRGYDRTFHADIAVVPEPSTIALGAAGLIGLVAWRRRTVPGTK